MVRVGTVQRPFETAIQFRGLLQQGAVKIVQYALHLFHHPHTTLLTESGLPEGIDGGLDPQLTNLLFEGGGTRVVQISQLVGNKLQLVDHRLPLDFRRMSGENGTDFQIIEYFLDTLGGDLTILQLFHQPREGMLLFMFVIPFVFPIPPDAVIVLSQVDQLKVQRKCFQNFEQTVGGSLLDERAQLLLILLGKRLPELNTFLTNPFDVFKHLLSRKIPDGLPQGFSEIVHFVTKWFIFFIKRQFFTTLHEPSI